MKKNTDISSFEIQYKEIVNFIQFEDFPLALKRIIDLTLDTEEISFYREAHDLLAWNDYNESNLDGKKEKYSLFLHQLYTFLVKKPIVPSTDLLEIKNLKKAYSKSSFALGPISFKLKEGEIIGLVGENGNGKTTLLRALCGELLPTDGEINYHFHYQNNYDLRSRLVYIPQRYTSWQGAILDQLRFAAASYGIKGEENLLLVELVLSRLGLRNYQNLQWKNLSSGYKMRFELARMLIRKPKLLLIDEPLANLDINAQQTVLNDFKSIAKSPFRPLGIILSSQQLYEVEKAADQVVFLKNGEKKYTQSKINSENSTHHEFIIEFETEWQYEKLYPIFSALEITKLQFNGGSFLGYFPKTVTMNHFLQLIIENNIPIKYLRDISNSTRRFFI